MTTVEEDLRIQVETLKANIIDRDKVLDRLSTENAALKKEVARLTKLTTKPKRTKKPASKKPKTKKPTPRKKK